VTKQVDSYPFISGITKRMIKTWVGQEQPRPIPWTPLMKPLPDCTVAMISSAGVALANDEPFDQERERRNPWWGNPSYRIIPKTATEEDVRLYHMHIDPQYAQRDLNCLFPLARLLELERAGEVGRSAERHYSIMGYILQLGKLLAETVPVLIRKLKEDHVDAVVLVPA
jgi:D-proline reductase (dithiol) PrdB